MANQGKRMVKEYLIAEIGKESVTDVKVNGTSVVEDTVANITIEPAPTYTAGDNITIEDGVISATDTTYTAGTGIDITSDTISVDGTVIPTKSEIENDYKKMTLIEYKTTPQEVYNELVAEDPSTTYQQAITEWLKRMPVFLGRSANGMSYATALGCKNVYDITKGDTIRVNGYFMLIAEGTSSPYTPSGLNIFTTDGGSSATVNLMTRTPNVTVDLNKCALQQYVVSGCRFGPQNTSLNDFADLLNNRVLVQGLTNNPVAFAGMSCKNTITYGREQEGAFLVVGGGVGANVNVPSQLTVPTTTDGTYVLKATVASGVVTYAWVLEV